MRLLLVYNPNARLALRVRPQQLMDELRGLGAEIQLAIAKESAEADALTRKALSAGVDRVVVAGGDGTVSAVIDALAGTDVPIAVIPLGTGNVLAAEAGLSRGDWRSACRAAVGDILARIDLGRAGTRYFATMFGAGLDAQMVLGVEAEDKHSFGRLAFIGQLFKTLSGTRPSRFTLTEGDQTLSFRAWSVMICNTARFAWRLQFAPEARPADGLLNLCRFSPRSRPSVILQGAACFALRSRVLAPDVHVHTVTGLVLDADPPVPWQADGEIGGTTPVQVDLVPHALTVAVRHEDSALYRGRWSA